MLSRASVHRINRRCFPADIPAPGWPRREPVGNSAFRKPSVGLEPTTPSLPWKVRVGTDGHARARTGKFCLQSTTFALPVHARTWSPLPIVSCAHVTPATGGHLLPSRSEEH